MTKQEFVDRVAQRANLSRREAAEAVDAVLDSIADDCGIGPDGRATLYSSTEYKKIRLHYFTDDYARWEEEQS